MFRVFFFLGVFMITISSRACVCDPLAITDKWVQADVVARVKILKNYPNESEKEIYQADIQVLENFKGIAPKSILVAGRSDGTIGSSCAVFIPEGTELIIYTQKEERGKHSVGACSGLLYMHAGNRNQALELDILRNLRDVVYDYLSRIQFKKRDTGLENLIKEVDAERMKSDFAIYEVTLTSDLKVSDVKILWVIDEEVDTLILEQLYNSKWKSFDRETVNHIPEQTKLLIGIYKYQDQGARPFLTTHYL